MRKAALSVPFGWNGPNPSKSFQVKTNLAFFSSYLYWFCSYVPVRLPLSRSLRRQPTLDCFGLRMPKLSHPSGRVTDRFLLRCSSAKSILFFCQKNPTLILKPAVHFVLVRSYARLHTLRGSLVYQVSLVGVLLAVPFVYVEWFVARVFPGLLL